MSFPSIRAAVHSHLRTYTSVTNVIGGMPTNIHHAPAFVTQFQSGERIGSTHVYHWRFMVHAIMEHQANDLAESEIDAMVPAVYQAFSPRLFDGAGRERSRLGGAAETCWFESVLSGDADGYITFGSPPGEKTFRHIGFVLVVKTHETY